MKKYFTILIVLICWCTISSGQSLPNYLPNNGLVGWWPFSNNTNDESGNGNNGSFTGLSCGFCGTTTVTAAPSSSPDRFGSLNNSFFYNDSLDFISIQNSSSLQLTNNFTISTWLKPYSFNFGSYTWGVILAKWGGTGDASYQLRISNNGTILFDTHNGTNTTTMNSSLPILINQWSNIVIVQSGSVCKIYINSTLSSVNNNMLTPLVMNNPIEIGRNFNQFPNYANEGFLGDIDDIGMWNRALTELEINDLFNASNCSNSTDITPQTNSIENGSTATFIASTSDPNPNYVWQSDFGQGYVTLNDFGNYTGSNTNTLSISSVQLANHNVPIRVISTSGDCIDTSNVATISILDTCITSINDTTFITVTDTLVINTLITGINPPNNSNTIKVYPNPANSHITIEYGDFAIMNGYQLKIENSLGQEVFQTSITQESDYLNLNTWGGNGLYFIHIVDPQGNTIDIRKIVLQ
jgi:hypothetical protein